MNKEELERQAREMSTSDLHATLDWYRALAEHFDDNMDFNGYNSVIAKMDVVKDELRVRRE